VGTKFKDEDVSRVGQIFFVIVDLPNGPIEAVVSVISHERSKGEQGKGKRLVAASLCNMNDSDTARLAAYLDKCAERKPVLAVD
jgi:hypothetical protein